MSKLDEIMNKAAEAQSFQSIKQWEATKIDFKILILELSRDSLEEAGNFHDFGDVFRKKIEEL